MQEPTGVTYLLEFLREVRGKRVKQEVDLLGVAFSQYFQTTESMRRDRENLNDVEKRHSVLVRDVTQAMVEIGCKDSVPTETYGWFAISKLLRLDPSDVEGSDIWLPSGRCHASHAKNVARRLQAQHQPGFFSVKRKMKGERPTGFNGRPMRRGKIGHKATQPQMLDGLVFHGVLKEEEGDLG